MEIIRYLEDIKNYCEENNIIFKDMPPNEIKKHIRIMLKRIANNKSLKNS